MNQDWYSLDIGYQARVTNSEICKAGAKKPQALRDLEKTFKSPGGDPHAILHRMTKGGNVEAPEPPEDSPDDWAAHALVKLINGFLAEAGSTDLVSIDPVEDFVRFGPAGAKSLFAKGKDTRCVLRGDKWYSIRSYRIGRAIDPKDPWFPAKAEQGDPDLSASVDYMIATLTWICQRVS